MKTIWFVLFYFLIVSISYGQELYPLSEPASTMPKNALGVRYTYEQFQNNGGYSNIWQGLRLMYGFSPRFTLMATVTASNHHTRKMLLPSSVAFANHHSAYAAGVKPNKMKVEGVNFYGKYRLLSIDGPRKHLRLATFGEFSIQSTAHDEAEPILSGDNSGVGGGLILTRLYKRFSATGAVGFILPFKYSQDDVSFKSGNAFTYNFAFGYLLFPIKYNSYMDFNVNLFVEIHNKIYGQAAYIFNNEKIDNSLYPTLKAGRYSNITYGLQYILASNIKLDFSLTYSLYQKPKIKLYPIGNISIQSYFYF